MGHPADYLLSGVVRCGQCGRAFIGTAATGRSRRYHYYTCSTRYRYGTRNCAADRLPKDALEEAVLEQMIEIKTCYARLQPFASKTVCASAQTFRWQLFEAGNPLATAYSRG